MDHVGGNGSGDGGGERWAKGRGCGRPSWTPKPQQSQEPMRRPHFDYTNQSGGSAGHERASQERVNNDMVNNERANLELAKNSLLSANAAVFIPKTIPTVQPPVPVWPGSTVQDRINIARQQGGSHQQHSHYHPHHQQQHQHQQHQHPMQFQQYAGMPQEQRYGHYPPVDYTGYCGGSGDYNDRHQTQQTFGREKDEQRSDLSSTMRQMENAMHTLTLNPGRFESLLAHLVDTINPHLKHPNDTQQIITAILIQSINEGNFRYSGARLCTYLDKISATSDRASSVFRDTLFARCREETEVRSAAWLNRGNPADEEEKKCHGMILFLAELVAQMELETSVLGKLLVQLISIVLKQPAANSAKYICQALKLAGQTLERDSGGSRKEMEGVMRLLTELVTEGRVDQHVSRMVHNVSELRRGNWGRVVSTHTLPSAEANHTTIPEQQSNEPVFYGPDGQVLSPEESRFLQDQIEEAAEPEEFGGADNEEGFVWNDEDEMIASAYEEFLKLTPTRTEGRVRR